MPVNGNIIGYTADGQAIYGVSQPVIPQATPRLMSQIPIQQNRYGQQQVEQPNSSDMTWVSGYIEAQSFRVAPGRSVPLWDSEEGRNLIYLKSTDVNGIPQKMRVLKYEDVTDSYNDGQPINNTTTSVLTADMVNDMIENRAEEIFEKKIKEHAEKNKHRQKPRNNRYREEYSDEE